MKQKPKSPKESSKNRSGQKDSANHKVIKRSSKYDVFNKQPAVETSGPNWSSWKEKFRYSWKFVRIGLMLALAALSLTGCIQSFTLGSSSTVGSGIELYNDKNKVAPYVNNFQIRDTNQTVPDFDENGNQKIDPATGKPATKTQVNQILDPLPKENFLPNPQTIAALQEQLPTQLKDQYGVYDNQSSSLRILDKNGQEIINPNQSLKSTSNGLEQLVKGDSGKYLFSNSHILRALDNDPNNNYEPQNIWKEINFFVTKRPANESFLTDKEKQNWGKGFANIDNSASFQAYEQNPRDSKWYPVRVENAQFVTYDVNHDGIDDVSQPVVIQDPNRLAKFRFAFDGEIVTLSTDKASFSKNSELFARDFIQSITNTTIQFSQYNPFIEKLKTLSPNQVIKQTNTENLTAAQRFELLTSTNLQKLFLTHQINPTRGPDQALAVADETKLLTYQERAAVVDYQTEMTGQLNRFGFGIKPQTYGTDSSKGQVPWGTPYEGQFFPNEVRDNVANRIIGGAPVQQKTVTNWGEAWSLGPFYGLVVWPLAFVMNGLVNSLPVMAGWGTIFAIFIAVIATRFIGTLLSYKSIFSQHKQQTIAPKKAKIDAKYEGHKGNKQLEQRKRQELADLYKKNNISFSAQFMGMLISSPIFLAMWRVIQGIVGIKSTTWLGIQFSVQSWRELFAGAWQYLPLMLIAVLFQAASQILPRYLNKKRLAERASVAEKAALKKSNKVQNIVMAVFIFLPLIFEAGVQIYWIVGAIWQIAITLIVHWIVRTEFYKQKLSKYV